METVDYVGRLVRRGDMGLVLLGALLDHPMYGYELIKALSEKSKGTWRPSPGSVYPTLQLLEERELVTSSHQNGKKVYTITELGREESTKRKPQAPSECNELDLEKIASLRTATVELMDMIKAITFKGSDADYMKAERIVTKASEQLLVLVSNKKEIE